MEINNLIAVSDTHSGCQLALCPPEGVTLDNGGVYRPSPFQLEMWAYWREFWDVWVPDAVNGEPFVVVHLGDAVDGVHHNSTSQISHNLTDQARIAVAVLQPEIAKAVAYYHIRGTGAHVGDAGMHEERLAHELGAVPNTAGQYARYRMTIRVGPRLIQCLHHIGTTGSSAYESSAVHKELIEAVTQAGLWGHEPPDVLLRGHRHRYIETSCPSRHGKARSVVLPGWQGLTPFTYRIPGARQSEPQFGGVLVRWSDKRQELFVRERVWTLAPEDPV